MVSARSFIPIYYLQVHQQIPFQDDSILKFTIWLVRDLLFLHTIYRFLDKFHSKMIPFVSLQYG